MVSWEPVLDLIRTEKQDVDVIAASGVLDIATVDRLEKSVGEVLSAGRGVVIDLAGVTLCDSTGLGVLVHLHRRARMAGVGFALRAPRRHVADVLAMTGIDKIITIEPARDSS